MCAYSNINKMAYLYAACEVRVINFSTEIPPSFEFYCSYSSRLFLYAPAISFVPRPSYRPGFDRFTGSNQKLDGGKAWE